MARLTCEAALGVGCAVGAVASAQAAQWSIAPTATIGVTNDSNPYLSPGAPSSQSATVSPSAVLQWSTETMNASLTPWLSWQRMNGHDYPDVDDRSLQGTFAWLGERASLNAQGSISDMSTLSSALIETGLIALDVRQRTKQAQATWTWNQAERRSLVLQASWSDVSYQGFNSFFLNLLQGYQYINASIGERFDLTPRSSLTVSGFNGELLSPLPGSDSRQSGLQLDYAHHFTERTSLDLFAGASERSLAGKTSTGAQGGLTLSMATPRGHLDLNYADSLQPYGTGVLAQRQSLTLSDTQNLTEKLDIQLALARIQNDDTVVRLGVDRRYYNQLTLGLNWHFAEIWRLGLQVGVTQAESLPQPPLGATRAVTGWHTALNLTWNPHPLTRSF